MPESIASAEPFQDGKHNPIVGLVIAVPLGCSLWLLGAALVLWIASWFHAVMP